MTISRYHVSPSEQTNKQFKILNKAKIKTKRYNIFHERIKNDARTIIPLYLFSKSLQDGDCYCFIDGVFSPVSTMTALQSPLQCTDEDLNRNKTVFNLYKKTKRNVFVYKQVKHV